jgi:hypothetical protein
MEPATESGVETSTVTAMTTEAGLEPATLETTAEAGMIASIEAAAEASTEASMTAIETTETTIEAAHADADAPATTRHAHSDAPAADAHGDAAATTGHADSHTASTDADGHAATTARDADTDTTTTAPRVVRLGFTDGKKRKRAQGDRCEQRVTNHCMLHCERFVFNFVVICLAHCRGSLGELMPELDLRRRLRQFRSLVTRLFSSRNDRFRNVEKRRSRDRFAVSAA